MKLSLVISVFNEEDNIEPLVKKIQESLKNFDYEVIFVDDGSSDETVNRISEFGNKNFKIIVFNKNFGQTAALAAGIDNAKGEYIATLDGDLQNDPDDIPEMIKNLKRLEHHNSLCEPVYHSFRCINMFQCVYDHCFIINNSKPVVPS